MTAVTRNGSLFFNVTMFSEGHQVFGVVHAVIALKAVHVTVLYCVSN